ncbi:MAG: pilus assembly FimT family protein [Synechococcus sp.]
MNSRLNGFSLFELLVGVVIVSVGLSFAIPSYLRRAQQTEVDLFTQQLEDGLYSFRRKLMRKKASCTLNFPTTAFNSPANVIEMNQNPERLECCSSDYTSSDNCGDGADLGLRLLVRERTPESERVNVKVNMDQFTISPIGIIPSASNLLFLVRTNNPSQNSRTRCLELSASGSILRGSWENNACIS